MTDVIADMLTRIRNALSARHETVEIPASNTKKAIAEILLNEGYIEAVDFIKEILVKKIDAKAIISKAQDMRDNAVKGKVNSYVAYLFWNEFNKGLKFKLPLKIEL